MQFALRMTAQVQAGGKLELVDSQLPVGTTVEVIVLLPPSVSNAHRSVLDILNEAPGHLACASAAEVDSYMRMEREAWER